jgi:hypothetical protein
MYHNFHLTETPNPHAANFMASRQWTDKHVLGIHSIKPVIVTLFYRQFRPPLHGNPEDHEFSLSIKFGGTISQEITKIVLQMNAHPFMFRFSISKQSQLECSLTLRELDLVPDDYLKTCILRVPSDVRSALEDLGKN